MLWGYIVLNTKEFANTVKMLRSNPEEHLPMTNNTSFKEKAMDFAIALIFAVFILCLC
jgi:hypothetical protein